MEFRFECPHCGQHISAMPDQIGLSAPCPNCNAMISIRNPLASVTPPPLPQQPPPTPTTSSATTKPTTASGTKKVLRFVGIGCGGLFICFFGLAILIAIFSPSSNSSHSSNESSPTTSERSPTVTKPTPSRYSGRVTVGGYIASPSEELFDKATTYVAQDDSAALKQLLRSGLVIELKDGIPIELMDTKVFSGKVKIRPRGSTIELWTFSEAIRSQ